MNVFPDKNKFLKLCKKGNLVPVYKEILGDLDTPVSAYFKIAGKARYSFLLESVEGEAKVARFSFLAKDPELVLRTKNNTFELLHHRNKRIRKEKGRINDNPLTLLRNILKEYKFVNVEGLPRFCGGLVGYASYDIVRFFERLPEKTEDDLKLPDAIFALAKDLLIFDHLNHKIKIVSLAHVDKKNSDRSKIRQYNTSLKRIAELETLLKKPSKTHQPAAKRTSRKKRKSRSNFSSAQFKKIVKEAKRQIRAGEIIQVVLSQRFQVDLTTNPFNIYRALRALNPSPYMYFLNLDDMQIVGSSPELLVRCEDGVVDTRPIAGTRPRGEDEAEDDAHAVSLLADPKERAEHIMLVDLGRNDLGRVCRKGSVHLSEFMNIERYSHVMHIVSNVRGKLKPSMDDFDVLKAAFPAGTVSGAPKIRAMEIIEDLEKERRGPYAGCIGYFSFSGNLDTCITIRTIVVKGKKAYVQAGAGIVADSDPAKEYQETLNKAKAQIRAIEMAHDQT